MDKQQRVAHVEALPFERTVAGRVGVFAGLWRAIRDVVARRELLALLVRRELKARYKDSSLGFLWSLIKPLTMLLIYFVAIGQFLGAARAIPDFAIFVYAGLTLWALYSEIVVTGTQSILANAGLIKKVYLPREIFPLAATGSAFVNFGVQFLILVAAVVALGQFPLSWNLLYIPVAVAIAAVYGIALALLLSAVNVYLRDIQYLVEVGLLVFFWASPIVYSWSFVVEAGERSDLPWLESAYLINPMSTAILAFQRGIWAAGSQERVIGGVVVPPQPWPADLDLRLLITFLVGLVLVVIAQRVFSRLQGNFAQEI
ncbi:ABC transporter permease [Microcella frigidaquae]|uniref:Transport permease protein n=1 Tax=Microcella frigidaquae TaxID=424758 RepID=A0A840X835_9MICO|nr:ABC transporter permease [Microcella frigidaquae]MBB5618530.1 ABC-2 type transport system permease protein [Microcella frigidaquae]NHN44571.1 ABC transporter permease [Microcella frigidaquae]